MFEYTFHNHFQFGYQSDRLYAVRSTSDEIFYARYSQPSRPITSWREANTTACLEISRKAVGDIWVLLSGGVDSEICLRSFLESKIPVRVASLRLKNGLNNHDMAYVKKLEAELSLQVTYFDLDAEAFFNSQDMESIVNPIQCISPILAAHLWLADQLDGTPIIAQGEPYFIKQVPEDYIPGESPYLPSSWFLVESESLCSLYRHFILQDRPAIPGFFQYLPEQFYSYMKFNPILLDLVNNRIVGKLGTRTSKNKIAYQFYPELEPREKYNGFEKIQSMVDLKRSELTTRFPHSDQLYYIGYDELLSQLEPC